MTKPPIAISIGCPSGIGAEVAVLGAAHASKLGIRCVLVGDDGALHRAATVRGLAPSWIAESSDAESFGHAAVSLYAPTRPLAEREMLFGSPSVPGGRAQLAWVDAALGLVRSGSARALVTGPVSKDAIARSGCAGSTDFVGHTGHIARLLGVDRPVMIFVAGRAAGFLAVALVTAHIPLSQVPRGLTPDGVSITILRCADLLAQLGTPSPRIVVAGLNPHSGEQGLLGEEEREIIAPGIDDARRRIADNQMSAEVRGPMSGEAAFRQAFDGGFNGVVAMYHDQAMIPMKARFFGKAVNVTAGLPIVRTSVDHGTAYDIAGRGVADAGSMIEAIAVADRLASG